MSQEYLQIKVDGIPQSENLISLHRMLSKYGAIVDLTRGKNCVFVKYQTPEQAKKALESLDGNPMYGVLKKLRTYYVISKKPDCIVFYNINEEDLPKLNLILKKSVHFLKLVPLITENGFVPLAIAYFNQNLAVKSILAELKKSENVRKQIFFEVNPHVPQDTDSMIKLAEKYEKRTLYITGFYNIYPSEKSLMDHFERFGFVKVLEISKKYGIVYAVILLDTEENAKQCIRERNYSFINGNPMPLSVRPYLLKIPHPEAGLLTLNEYNGTLNWYDLYTQFEEYGEIYELALSDGVKSIMAFILFRNIESAYKARDGCNQPNVFVFPPEEAIKAIKFFIPQTRNPSTTLITQMPNISTFRIRDQLKRGGKEDPVAAFFSLLNPTKTRKIAVAKYKDIPHMINAISDCRRENTPFFVSSSSLFTSIYDWYNTIPIPQTLVKKIYYARNVGSNVDNKSARERFEKIAPVELAVNIPEIKKVLVIFKEVIDKNNPKLLNIFTNPIMLDDVLNVFQATRSLSSGELNAKFKPQQTLIDEIQKRDPSKIQLAKDKIRRMDSNDVMRVSSDPIQMEKFVEEITGIPYAPQPNEEQRK